MAVTPNPPSSAAQHRTPGAIFISGVVLNWLVIFFWAWQYINVIGAGVLLAIGTLLMFVGALRGGKPAHS